MRAQPIDSSKDSDKLFISILGVFTMAMFCSSICTEEENNNQPAAKNRVY